MEEYRHIACGMPVRDFLDAFLPTTSMSPAELKESRKPCPESRQNEQDLQETLVSSFSFVEEIASYLEEDVRLEGGHSNGNTDLEHTAAMCDLAKAGTEDLSWDSNEVRQVLQQIYAKIAEALNRHHRTHVFHVIVTPLVLRLLRMDRSGLVISAAISITKDSSDLIEFYERYARAPADMRGYDTTVQSATEDEIAIARPLLEKWIPLHGRNQPFHAFDVPQSDSQ